MGDMGHLTVSDLRVYIDEVFAEIERLEPRADFVYTTVSDDSRTVMDISLPYGSRFHTPYQIVIGFKSVLQNVRAGFVRDEDSVHALRASFHELHHVQLAVKEFNRIDASEIVKQMARVSVASKFLPEYYRAGYFYNPEEIACEVYSFERMEQFCDEHNINFDWK